MASHFYNTVAYGGMLMQPCTGVYVSLVQQVPCRKFSVGQCLWLVLVSREALQVHCLCAYIYSSTVMLHSLTVPAVWNGELGSAVSIQEN